MRLLIVDDDPDSLAFFRGVFTAYSPPLTIFLARDAGEALERFFTFQARPDAMIVDVLMSYGNAPELADTESQQDESKTGIKLVEYIRAFEDRFCNEERGAWIAITTAASPFNIGHVKRLLRGHGNVYIKPYNPLSLEHDVVQALGLESKVPPALLNPAEPCDNLLTPKQEPDLPL